MGQKTIYPDDPLHWGAGWVGLVVGINPVGGWLFGLFIGKYLVKIGRRKVMLISLIVTVITLFALGLTYELRFHSNWFMVVSLVSRFIQGMARSGYGSTSFAYCPLLWPNKIERMIAIIESCTGNVIIIFKKIKLVVNNNNIDLFFYRL